jgi:hypothetical protein
MWAVLCTRGEWPWSMNRNDQQTVAWEWLVSAPSVCVRFTLQGLKFGSNCSASHEYWDCLISLLHRVRSETKWYSIWLDEINSLHVWIDRCKSRMVNKTRTWKLKLEIKNILVLLFSKRNPKAFISLACLVKGMLYTLSRVSLAEY